MSRIPTLSSLSSTDLDPWPGMFSVTILPPRPTRNTKLIEFPLGPPCKMSITCKKHGGLHIMRAEQLAHLCWRLQFFFVILGFLVGSIYWPHVFNLKQRCRLTANIVEVLYRISDQPKVNYTKTTNNFQIPQTKSNKQNFPNLISPSRTKIQIPQIHGNYTQWN